MGEEPPAGPDPNRYGVALSYGNSFFPDGDIGFLMGTLLGIFDFDKIGEQVIPDSLRLKVELSLGSTTKPEYDVMASAGAMVLYYIHPLSTPFMTPYIEGGLGIIYTNFQVEGQGSRVNFNPRAGFGAEFPLDGKTIFSALRWDHLSNAGLSKDNQSVDSVVLMVGVHF
ncbi:MAG: acyloxyacyl hydrolase [Deltaproteobacteria bacterium]|nr:acyloxyacyl hydrolase [Deltaproteobacteria bacterium]